MSKKFDVVIGNPPYQDEAIGGATSQMPVYHLFMDAAYEVGKKAVLITPARFLFNAGSTPKAWNAKMLSDPHLTVPVYVPNSDNLFPGTDIKGGIAVTYRDEDTVGGPIVTFVKHSELNEVLHKVLAKHEPSLETAVTRRDAFKYTQVMHDDEPQASSLLSASSQFIVNSNAFEQVPFVFHEAKPVDGHDYVHVLGLIKNKRMMRWARSSYISGPKNFGTYKVAFTEANGSGTLGEVLSSPLVLGPDVAVTQTFLTIGTFGDQSEAEACLSYIKGKFARAMLGVLKVTQHTTAQVWKHVPLQNFTSASDIDWSKSIPEIDQQLYAKYKLDADEIGFIESHVKPMG
jgi:hypothetical protein